MASKPSAVVTMPSNKLCGGRIQTAAGKATAAAMEATETYRVRANTIIHTPSAITRANGASAKINPGAGGNAFAALESEPAGVIVSEHGENPGDDVKSIWSSTGSS